jgi:FAD/FMN-containing dehydrogenase
MGAAQRAAPRSRGAGNALAARLSGSRPRVDEAYLAFTAERRVRFVEMEYVMPRSTATAVLRELRQLGQRHEVGFPVEVRFGPADDLWLSPAHARDSVYVSVHSFRRVEYERWFADCEALFVAYDGRPHWAKMHSRKASDLAAALPRWQAFQAVRDRVDPNRVFSSAYVRGLLGD